ncbi:hypothetical protein EV126DRAFT_253107 [Verticillium dahliae]|nr:hypothetical protein EV126DRAFT_253107 [Verticillium dahliae]
MRQGWGLKKVRRGAHLVREGKLCLCHCTVVGSVSEPRRLSFQLPDLKSLCSGRSLATMLIDMVCASSYRESLCFVSPTNCWTIVRTTSSGLIRAPAGSMSSRLLSLSAHSDDTAHGLALYNGQSQSLVAAMFRGRGKDMRLLGMDHDATKVSLRLRLFIKCCMFLKTLDVERSVIVVLCCTSVLHSLDILS